MASPQTEEGYTKIANELLEAFSQIDASGSAWRVFMVVLRKTYGFHKKEDRISLTQFEMISKLTRMSVCRGLNELVELKIIIVEKEGYINKYSIQKDYGVWGSIKPVTSNKNDTKSSIKPVTKTSNRFDTHKRKKDNKDTSEEKSSRLKDNKKDMAWKNNQGDEPDLPDVDLDTGEIIKPKVKPKHICYTIYKLFEEITGIYPLNWNVNKSQRIACENLEKEHGIEQVKKALRYYMENKEEKWCPKILSPWDLDTKWKNLYNYKEEHG